MMAVCQENLSYGSFVCLIPAPHYALSEPAGEKCFSQRAWTGAPKPITVKY